MKSWSHERHVLPSLFYNVSVRPLADRFWEKVERNDGCWLWQGAMTSKGYGAIGAGGRGGKMLVASRAALILSGVEVPNDAFVCHTCDNRRCVNPAHLYVGTASDNNRDTVARNPAVRRRHALTGDRIRAGLKRHWDANRTTHCRNGHPFDEVNTACYSGKRRCRACERDRMRERRSR